MNPAINSSSVRARAAKRKVRKDVGEYKTLETFHTSIKISD